MLKQFLLGTAIALGIASSANAVIIDDFTDAGQFISLSGNPQPRSATAANNEVTPGAGGGVAGASIIGGFRDITTTLVSAPLAPFPLPNPATLAAVINTLGYFSHSQDTGVQSNSYITWDGLGGLGGLGGVDLTDGGNSNNFRLLIKSADAGVVWSLEVFDSVNSAIHIFPNLTPITSPQSLYLPFSLFTGVDFTQVNKIVFGANITNVADLDTAIDLIETVGVPEPASVALIGAGLMGLGAVTRRRKAA